MILKIIKKKFYFQRPDFGLENYLNWIRDYFEYSKKKFFLNPFKLV